MAMAQSGVGSGAVAAPAAIVAVDRSGRIALVNDRAERLFGYARTELLGQPVQILVPEAAAEMVAAAAAVAEMLSEPPPAPAGRPAAAAGRPRQAGIGGTIELVGRRKDGIEFPAGLALSTIETDDGLLVAAEVRDVSGHQQADARFRGLLEAAPDAIVGVAPDGTIALVNTQVERLFGYPPEELVGQSVEILVPAAVRPEHPAHRAGYLTDPRPRPMGAGMHLAARRRDGAEFAAEISLSVLDNGPDLLVVAAIRDVTDRHRAEAMFRGMLEAGPDAVIGVAPDGTIVLANAQVERLFGYPPEELIGQSVELLVPHGKRDQHPAHRGRYFADPRPRPMGAGMQLAARRRDGSEFPAEISLSAVDIEDGLVVSAAIRDVTDRIEAQAERERLKAQAERERLESHLHQSQRLESLGQLAGGIAHDFNNLLAVILNYSTFVEEEIGAAARAGGGSRWQTAQQDIEQVRRAAERATALTHQLLAFGRREVVRPRVLNLNDIVVDMQQLLRRTLGEHIELSTELSPELCPVLADPGQIEQVLVNLAVNARDAMPGGGSLLVDTANFDVDDDYATLRHGLKPGRHARLRVSDTGTGMSKDVLNRVFEPFYSTKPKGEGTGLGLATVYGIVSQADGHAQIYSEPGFGTTFTALLPTTDERPQVADLLQPTGGMGGAGETVLVVEDEDAMREVTRRILSRSGYRVITAENGAAAVELAGHQAGGVELLVTDVIMPRMLGKEVADLVKAVRPEVRVLYMSGYAHRVLASRGTLEAGVALIEKPFTQHQLLTKVREVLDGPGPGPGVAVSGRR